MLFRLCLLATVLAIAGCAAATPGFTPASFKQKSKFGQPLESGDVGGPEGRYEMSEQEKLMDCKRMAGSMHITILRLKHMQNEVQTSDLSRNAQKSIAPVFGGSTRGADRQAEFARERAKLEAYNGRLAEKNCKTVDIDGELAKPLDPPGKKF